MPSYAAFIGHQPTLSLAELTAAVPECSLTRVIGKQVALFDTPEELTDKSLRQLGGTISIARRFDAPVKDTAGIAPLVYETVRGMKGKVTFGLRTVGVSPSALHELYRTTKLLLKKHGVSSRYVGNEREPAPSVVLHQEDMLSGKSGVEVVILQLEDLFWVGKTVAAQDIDAYTKRDIKKPVRDTTVGLLPPKLAQILLNLGEWLAVSGKPDAKKKKKPDPVLVWDPFCGTGVIPIECLLRGWPVYASDMSMKAVTGCETNLDWIRKEEKILKKEVMSQVWKQDATKPFDFSSGKPVKLKDLPQVIITETSLGPALKNRPPLKDVQKMRTENDDMQSAFLQSIAESLPGTPIVCTWPVWYYSRGQVYIEKTLKNLAKLGYEAVLPPGIQPTDPERPTIVYRRPDQFVGREVVMLRPMKKA